MAPPGPPEGGDGLYGVRAKISGVPGFIVTVEIPCLRPVWWWLSESEFPGPASRQAGFRIFRIVGYGVLRSFLPGLALEIPS